MNPAAKTLVPFLKTAFIVGAVACTLGGCSSEPTGPEAITDLIATTTVASGTASLEIYTDRAPQTGATQVAVRLLESGSVVRDGSIRYRVSAIAGQKPIYCPVAQPTMADSRGLFSGDVIFIPSVVTPWTLEIESYDATGTLRNTFTVPITAEQSTVNNVRFDKESSTGAFWATCLAPATRAANGVKLRLLAQKRPTGKTEYEAEEAVTMTAQAVSATDGSTVQLPSFTYTPGGWYSTIAPLHSGTWTVTATLARTVPGKSEQDQVGTFSLETVVP